MAFFFFQFVHGAAEICQAFEDAGYWADFIEPSSGKPVSKSSQNIVKELKYLIYILLQAQLFLIL